MLKARQPSWGWLAPLALAVPVLLVAGLAGGLLRAGVALPVGGDWLGAAVQGHAFLMICGVLATVIAIERAVAVRHPLCLLGPLASAVAGLSWLAGAPGLAAWLVVGAALAFVAVNAVIIGRQRAAHTLLLGLSALCWAVGSLAHARGAQPGVVVPWWFAFLVLTIAAERLEMTRLMRRRQGSAAALYAILGAMLLGAALSGLLFGLALAALAVWLLVFDIARRTVRAPALSRYMAVCLLLGYGWLFVAGLAWAATALGRPWRDAALHGLSLGFVVGMVFGHAPVILPAIARVKLLFGWPFYLPLAALHASLALRLFGGQPVIGAAGNALAIAGFAALVAGSAVAWRRHHPPSRQGQHGIDLH